MHHDDPQKLAHWFREAKSISVLTGATMSAESGVPTFPAHRELERAAKGSRMTIWRVIALSNAHGAAFSREPWDSVTVVFVDDEIVLSSGTIGGEHTRTTTEYRGIGLGHGHYHVVIPEAKRCAMLREFSREHGLDRSWIEEGEAEVWQLTLVDHEYPICGVGRRTIYLAVR
jgi:hypothetical protein